MASLDKDKYSNMLSKCGLAVALTVSLSSLTSIVAYGEKYNLSDMILLRCYHSFMSLWPSSNSSNDNEMRVIQGFITHDVVARPQNILDQLASGLNTLGFQTAMKEYPSFLEALFVPSNGKLNADSVIGVLQFLKDMDDNERTVAGFTHTFIQNAEVDTLEKFLFLPLMQRFFLVLGLQEFRLSLIEYNLSLHICLLEIIVGFEACCLSWNVSL